MAYPMTESLKAAATLMAEQRHVDAIVAYRRICETEPQHAAMAASQVGAAYFFLHQFDYAIQWYRYAGSLGFDATMTAENIAEAEQAARSRRPQIGDIALMDDGQVLQLHGDGTWRPTGW
ncbi:MAG: hypothetical protein K1X88_31670 [Nannocystaceae bacterium]|nr:hypothetical protein [Nannocystaceae bacterium]